MTAWPWQYSNRNPVIPFVACRDEAMAAED
ncbi:hypothetical protein JOD64_001959 [Micromonospora luteifusca]|uniref:Uncharacterized protein n=1 Tax=Micromonospora luteifusca TaxID=709860 RepID=A0ABS2LRI4_9ACTN|nr:hypothetical protein [Micromonospora luteifusca]